MLLTEKTLKDAIIEIEARAKKYDWAIKVEDATDTEFMLANRKKRQLVKVGDRIQVKENGVEVSSIMWEIDAIDGIIRSHDLKLSRLQKMFPSYDIVIDKDKKADVVILGSSFIIPIGKSETLVAKDNNIYVRMFMKGKKPESKRRIAIYTDASVGSKSNVATAVVTSDGCGLGMKTEQVAGSSSGECESKAVLMGLEYFFSLDIKGDFKIISYTDSIEVVVNCKGLRHKKNLEYPYDKIKEYMLTNDLQVLYSEAIDAPNSACDLVSNMMRRRIGGE